MVRIELCFDISQVNYFTQGNKNKTVPLRQREYSAATGYRARIFVMKPFISM